MPISEARVVTDRPSRYLVQLCRHMGNRGRHMSNLGRQLNNRVGHLGNVLSHRPGASHPRPKGPIEVEWSETDGLVSMEWGRCVLRAGEGVLVLRAEATDADNLGRIQDLLTDHVARFSRRAPLTVTWQPLADHS